MKIIAGLGNPGDKYTKTRHNAGFEAVDIIADKCKITMKAFEKHGIVGKGMIGQEKVMLVKPQTYMNLSGVCINALMSYYKLDIGDLLVIYDDCDLEAGKIRIRKTGSSGGHNGIKNIINELGTKDFDRIRIGVGRKPAEWDLADWVLAPFGCEDRKKYEEALIKASDAAACIVAYGADKAMNDFN